jgi:cyclic pyranopterin phosphate synthase
MNSLSHFDDSGAVRMVDVTDKKPTYRTARAHAFVKLSPEVIRKLPDNPKGNPLEVARIAGISGAKRTSELIPLCHPLMLTNVDVRIELGDGGAEIHTEVATTAATGVEMEALTAASIAALTIYDMTKALDKSIEISDVYLLEKKGGKSGSYRRSQTTT